MFIELTPKLGKTKSLVETTGLVIMEDSDGCASIIINSSITRVQEQYEELRARLNYQNLIVAPVDQVKSIRNFLS